MTTNFFTGMAKSLKPLFVNNFTREFARSFKDPDDYLELKLNEICSQCPFNQTKPDNNNSGSNISIVDECRKEYFGQLLQSFVGRPGDDETIKLYSYLRKCEDCLSSKKKNTFELTKSNSLIKN
jgi:hypothetical protein